MFILIMTPVGRTETGQQIDYFPQRWSGSSGEFKVTTFFPFSLAYLSASLKRDTPHQVRMVDANYYGVDSDEYVDIVCQLAPDLLIVEVDSIIFRKQLAVFRRLKETMPGLKILACGPSPTSEPEQTLAGGADFVATGEFEESITGFVINDCQLPSPGIYPTPRTGLVDVNALPLPEDDDIHRRDYCRLYGSEYREVEMWATRGCPVMCNFCVVTNVYYGKANFRTREVSAVIDEIRYLQRTIPDLEGIFFNEEAHNFNRKYVHELCHALIESGLNKELRFNCMGNYDTMDAETLALMQQAGYYKVRIGLESLEPGVMKWISRNGRLKSNQEKLTDVLKNCRDLGIKVYATLSVGTLGASFEQDIKTLDTIKDLHRDGFIQEFSLSINTPMPGTPFYEQARQQGWLIDKSSDFDGAYGAMINLPGYTAEKINQAFDYGSKVRASINARNVENGIRYSSYDRQWCAPVYATSQRKVGEGIL